MEDIKINKDGFMAKLIIASYKSSDLPKTLCPFFWKLLFAFVLLPLQWAFVWYNYKNAEEVRYRKEHWYINVLLNAILHGLLLIIIVHSYRNPIGTLTGTGIIIGGILAIIGVSLLGIMIKDYFINRRKQFFNTSEETKKSTLLSEFIKGVKNKYCPRITYIEEGQEYLGCKKDF